MGVADLFGKPDAGQKPSQSDEDRVFTVRKLKVTIFWVKDWIKYHQTATTVYENVDGYNTSGNFLELHYEKNGSRNKRLIFPAHEIEHAELEWVETVSKVTEDN